jgi:hypothetical protein
MFSGLEIGQDGSIYTTEIDKCCTSGHLFLREKLTKYRAGYDNE